MNSYFFKMNKQEKDNILDQHKYLYDGYVTKYNQQSNQTPLYVQDLANDKMGLTVNNKGVVKTYSNMNINETHTGLDIIGGDPHGQSKMKYRHLKNGTVDFDDNSNNNLLDKNYMNDEYPSPNENENEYMTSGNFNEKMTQNLDQYEYDIDELDDYSSSDQYGNEYEDLSMYNPFYGDDEDTNNYSYVDDVDDDEKFDLLKNVNESLSMFKKFKNYN